MLRTVPSCAGTRWRARSLTPAVMALAFALAVMSALSALLAVSPPAAHAEPANVVEIHIDNFAFTPAEVTIAPGTTVRWINRDDIPHTVAERSAAFKSKPMDTDDTFTHTFDAAGVVDYFCSLHPHMTGRVIVKAP